MDFIFSPPSLERAVELVAAGFSRPVSPELIADTELHLPAHMSISALDGETIIAFASFDIYADGDLLYLKGVMIHPDYQSSGLASQMSRLCIEQSRARFYGLRTQSPRMWAAGSKLCDIWLPAIDGSTDSELLEMAAHLAEYGNYPYVRGIYEEAMYGEKPNHHDPAIQAWWDDNCDFHAGDAVICIGRLRSSRE